MAKRRRFSEEFKREAVGLANQPGVTKAQVGRELGVNPNLLTRWMSGAANGWSKAVFWPRASAG